MKLVKRISLFMTLSVIMLGLGGWGALKAEEFFYPHRYRNSYEQAGTGSADSLRQSVSQLADAVSQSAPFSQDEQIGTAVKEQVIDSRSLIQRPRIRSLRRRQRRSPW